MKKILNIILSIILFACCTLSLSACNTYVVNVDTVINPRLDTIKVGYIDYAPLNYMYKGKFTGYNTKLATSVFNTLGYNVEFVLVEPTDEDRRVVNQEDVEKAFKNKKIDCFWGGITDAVLNDDDKFYFSYNYMENSPCLVIVNSALSENSINKIEDFANKTVAFSEYSSGQVFFNENLANIPNVEFDICEKGQSSALHKVNSSFESANCAIVDTLFAYFNLEKEKDFGGLTLNTANNPQAFQISQKNYLRVVFNKTALGLELKNNVNKTLEFFANTTKTVDGELVSLLEYFALGESFKLAELKDFIADFSSEN